MTSICCASDEFDLWVFRGFPKTVFQEFIEEHKPPRKMREVLEAKKKELVNTDCNDLRSVRPVETADGKTIAFMKYDVDRVILAEKLKKFIEQNNLDQLDVAAKYVYPLEDQNGSVRWRVFSEMVPSLEKGFEGKKITLKELQQLIKVSEDFTYADWHDGNLIRSTDGKLVFVDTESEAFCSDFIHRRTGREFWWLEQAECFDKDACEYLGQRKKSLSVHKSGLQNTNKLKEASSSLLNDADKEILEEWLKHERVARSKAF